MKRGGSQLGLAAYYLPPKGFGMFHRKRTVGVLFAVAVVIPTMATAATINIINNSCKIIVSVTIDGRRSTANIGPNASGTFEMSYQCYHKILIAADGGGIWDTSRHCNGQPDFALNFPLIVDYPENDTELDDGSLLVQKTSLYGYTEIKITSKLDCVTITQLTANRGNCTVRPAEQITPKDIVRALKFGQVQTYHDDCENLIELQSKTNKGMGVFTW
jgi:hypothetical protein